MKVREEIETVVGDGDILLRVLKELGLHVWFRYEKYREEFAHEDVIVAIDETPVGIFVEIEGSEHGIAAMAERARPRSPTTSRLLPRPVPAAPRGVRHRRPRHGVRRIGCRKLTGRAPRALLLTAGLGTRLRPLTYVRAKAAVPINGEASSDASFAGWSRRPASRSRPQPSPPSSVDRGGRRRRQRSGRLVRYSWEQPVLGSAGGPGERCPSWSTPTTTTFLIVNGDTLTDVDIWALVARHRQSGALVTMALIPKPAARPLRRRRRRRGRVDHGVHRAGSGPTTMAFIGVQVASGAHFARLEDGVRPNRSLALPASHRRERRGHRGRYISEASFLDIGTPRDCLDTSLALAATEGARFAGSRVSIDDSAVLVRSMVWDDVTVGSASASRSASSGTASRFPDGARYERCAIVRRGRTPVGRRAPRGRPADRRLIWRPPDRADLVMSN